MRIVIALGGNALLRRGEPMSTDVQRKSAAPYPLDVLDAGTARGR
jgi:carbamate kinase